MDCAGCGTRRGCRCVINGAGLIVATGTGSGATPRVLTVTCEDVRVCIAAMFVDIGFEYDAGTGRLVVPAAVAAGSVLKANGDGTASWVLEG